MLNDSKGEARHPRHMISMMHSYEVPFIVENAKYTYR